MTCYNLTKSFISQAATVSAAALPLYLLFWLFVFAVFAFCIFLLSQNLKHWLLDGFVNFVYTVLIVQAGGLYIVRRKTHIPPFWKLHFPASRDISLFSHLSNCYGLIFPYCILRL
jgi:hypothetical protein